MTQARAPNWDNIRKEYETTNIKLRELAEKHGIPYPTIKSRKRRDEWEKDASPNKKDASKTKKDASKKRGGQPNNQNAKGNIGGGAPLNNKNAVGHGAPLRNGNAITHGLFRSFLPEDETYRELVDAVADANPLDMLWGSISMLYANIVFSQKTLFVTGKDDETRVIKKIKGMVPHGNDTPDGEDDPTRGFVEEIEYEYQHAWDKQTKAMTALARTMATFFSMVEKFLQFAGEDDKRRLELEKMVQSMQVEKEKLRLAKDKLTIERDKINPKSAGEQVIFVDDIKDDDDGEEN